MPNINIRRIIYLVRTKYLTLNYVVVFIAFIIAASWVWGALGVMQRNYELQKQVDYQQQQLTLAQLQTDNLKLEQAYYKTSEYQELAVRQDLGLGTPGEKLLILPANTPAVEKAAGTTNATTTANVVTSNFGQWMNFLFGSGNKDQGA